MTAFGFIPGRYEAGEAIAGVLEAISGNGSKRLERLAQQPGAVIRSFGAYVWAWPVSAFLSFAARSAAGAEADVSTMSAMAFLVRASAADLGSFLVSAAVLLAFCSLFQLKQAAPTALVGLNWFVLVSSYILFVAVTPVWLFGVPGGLGTGGILIATAVLIFLLFRLLRSALGGDALMAFMAILIIFVAGTSASIAIFN